MARLRDLQDIIISNVESVTVRSVDGEGDQLELAISTHFGEVTVRLVPWKISKPTRIIDLRKRTKAKRKRGSTEDALDAMERFLKK